MALGLALLTLGFLFAMVEIQIEGPDGWAASLPTWRVEGNPLLNVFWAGKPLTGYHLWLFTFMAAVFHLPLVMLGTFTFKLECRVIGSVMVFWVVEDTLWFLLNPAFGPARFNPVAIPWHRLWVLGVPADYWVSATAGCLLIAWSFQPPAAARQRLGRGA